MEGEGRMKGERRKKNGDGSDVRTTGRAARRRLRTDARPQQAHAVVVVADGLGRVGPGVAEGAGQRVAHPTHPAARLAHNLQHAAVQLHHRTVGRGR